MTRWRIGPYRAHKGPKGFGCWYLEGRNGCGLLYYAGEPSPPDSTYWKAERRLCQYPERGWNFTALIPLEEGMMDTPEEVAKLLARLRGTEP